MEHILSLIARKGNKGIGWYGLERILIMEDNPITKEGTLISILERLLEADLIETKEVLESIHPYYFVTKKGVKYLENLTNSDR